MIRSPRAQAFRNGREFPKHAARRFHANYDLSVIEADGVGRSVAGPAVAGPSLLANARECPFRQPIPEGERVGCSCSHRCEAEPTRSPLPNRGINVLECWECDIAPRLSWPDDG